MLIYSAIEIFVKSNLPKTQLDLFLNKLCVLQLFKKRDVKNWNLGIKLSKKDGYVIVLNFANHKHLYKENFSRYKKSLFYNKFERHDFGGSENYFYEISSDFSVKNLSDLIKEIILTIYAIKANDVIEVTVNSY